MHTVKSIEKLEYFGCLIYNPLIALRWIEIRVALRWNFFALIKKQTDSRLYSVDGVAAKALRY